MAQFFTIRHKFSDLNSLFFTLILLQLAKTLIIRRFLITKLRALPPSLSLSLSLSLSHTHTHFHFYINPLPIIFLFKLTLAAL